MVVKKLKQLKKVKKSKKVKTAKSELFWNKWAFIDLHTRKLSIDPKEKAKAEKHHNGGDKDDSLPFQRRSLCVLVYT